MTYLGAKKASSYLYNQMASFIDVAMDGTGNTIVVWRQEFDREGKIFLSEYRNDTWRHPVDLSDNISPNGGSAVFPRVAMDDAGNAIVVWRQWDGLNSQIFMSAYR